MNRILAVAFVVATAAPVFSPGSAAQAHADPEAGARSDSAAVAAVVHEFHRALESGDAEAARALLSADVRVLESGGIETLDEYTEHHLPADMAFAGAVEPERSELEVTLRGDVAWVVGSSRARGTFRDREIDSRGAELMVLARHGDRWRIEAIHWSSR